MIRLIRKTLHGFEFWRRWRHDDPVIREAATARDSERTSHDRSRQFQDALTARRTERLRAQFGAQASAMRADRRKRAKETLGEVASAFTLFAGGAALYALACPLDTYAAAQPWIKDVRLHDGIDPVIGAVAFVTLACVVMIFVVVGLIRKASSRIVPDDLYNHPDTWGQQ